MGDREVLETHSNSASKNTSETDIFPHGPKSLLTNVICVRTSKSNGGLDRLQEVMLGLLATSVVDIQRLACLCLLSLC